MSGRQGELRALTSARGVAAWLVVLYHIRVSLPPVPPFVIAVIDRGYLAVDFFFLLSGFVIALSWRDRLRETGWRAVPEFLRRRFARVWPLHAFVLTGGVGLALMLWATGRHNGVEYPFAELPLHYLLVQNWGFTGATSWNVPAWSISTEAVAYLLFPVAAMAVRVDRWPSVAILAVAILSIGGMAAVLTAGGVERLSFHTAQFGLLRCVIEFTTGTLLFELWHRHRRTASARYLSAGFVLAAGAAWMAGAAESLAAPLLLGGVLMTLAFTAGGRANPLERATLHRLGDWSYATYLVHFLMWKAFKLVLVHDEGTVAWPLIGLYLTTVLIASALLYRHVEMPAQAWLNARRRVRGTGTRAPAPR